MIPRVALREALSDPNLLGTAIAGDSWRSWRVLLIAAMGEELSEDEREIFTQLTGREREPLRTDRSVCRRDRPKRRKVQSNSDARHLHRGALRSSGRVGARRAWCLALRRTRSTGGEDHP